MNYGLTIDDNAKPFTQIFVFPEHRTNLFNDIGEISWKTLWHKQEFNILNLSHSVLREIRLQIACWCMFILLP